jgi:acetyl-CoA carboxylase biotin carboxyl carrier protein
MYTYIYNYSGKDNTMAHKIDFEEINKLVDLLENRDLAEFELEVEGFKIKITRSKAPSQVAHAVPQPSAAEIAMNPQAAGMTPIPETADGLHYIKSPMVGTFYRAPDPSSPPFVKIGEQVKPNQTICIIEAMKLMNEIEADIDGVIEEIFVPNGKAVEYGQKLFSIKPSS